MFFKFFFIGLNENNKILINNLKKTHIQYVKNKLQYSINVLYLQFC